MHIRAVCIAVEVEQYRQVHGDWPATLEEVFGDDPAKLPIDPFTDATPMCYLVDEVGRSVYSIGENGQDDGGSIEKSDAKRMKDVGFRLLSPHRRGATV